jgi:RimJ/RimL family protein N-acetyltransferase
VFPTNTASCRALEKNGFHLEVIRKNAVIKNGIVGDDMVWVMLRSEN